MKVGKLDIKAYNDRPVYRRAREGSIVSNMGYYCAFGAFNQNHNKDRK